MTSEQVVSDRSIWKLGGRFFARYGQPLNGRPFKYDWSDKKWHTNMNATADQIPAAPEFKYAGALIAGKR
jgi:hypothetical protein